MKKYISNNQGICPCCNSDNLDYDAVQFEDNMLYFPFTCLNCETQGEEWYSMDFTGHNVENEDGSLDEVSDILNERKEDN